MQSKRAVIWCAVSSKVQASDDKISLAYQEEQARAWCAANGYDVVAVLRVPGHSRRESDVLTLFEDYDALGITAYRDLRHLWQTRGLDALVAYSPDRLGRAQTLVSYVIENVVQAGVVVHMLQGGTIDRANYRMAIAFAGAAAAGEIDRLIARSIEARKALVKAGGRGSGAIPFWYTPVRDNGGRLITIRFNEAYRALFDLIADMLIAGEPYLQISNEVTRRGYRNNSGGLYTPSDIRRLVLMPVSWGHAGYNVDIRKQVARWQREQGEPVPAHVIMTYHAHEPAYTGARAAAVLAELHRRETITGRVRQSAWYRGIAVCGCCKYPMIRERSFYQDREYLYAICGTRKARRTANVRPECTNPQRLSEDLMRRYIDALLTELKTNSTVILTPNENAESDALERLRQQIAHADRRINELLRQSIDMGLVAPAAVPDIQREIQRLALEREHLQSDAQALEQQHARATQRGHQRADAVRSILNNADFWSEPEMTINRKLHLLFGDYRLHCLDGEFEVKP